MNHLIFPTRKLALFALLSAADLLLTWVLLQREGTGVYEANPLANWLLQNHGWWGIVTFKCATFLLAAGLAVAIFSRRRRAAHRLLNFGCAALGAVVLYGSFLACFADNQFEKLLPEDAATIGRVAAGLDERIRMGREYRTVLEAVLDDLVLDRCSLAQAAGRLADTEKATDPSWLNILQFHFPGLNHLQCLAASIVLHVSGLEHESPRSAPRLLQKLRAELHVLCGYAVPMNFSAPESIEKSTG